LSRNAFEADLDTLIGFHARRSTGLEFLAAVEWACGELSTAGYATRLETVPMGTGTTRKLVADRPGTGEQRELVIVAAHVDSVNSRGGPSSPAPGADDNASGSAGVLAIGRALADHTGTHDLRLILLAGRSRACSAAATTSPACPRSSATASVR
jgi:Zn-dependent M28 family amino/carboxypeptidase